jgi:hypothetical protein
MSEITAYFSHTIRGRKGVAATPEDMDANCARAQKVADWLREKVPGLKLYVPAEHEDFVQIAYLEKMLTEEQILIIDCKILQRMDFHIVLEEDGWRGGGIGVEIDAAKEANMPIFTITEMDDITVELLNNMIEEVSKAKNLKEDHDV